MRSIGSRLALWYAAAATLTLAALLGVGYYLLQGQLIRGLDLLIAAEFEQIKAHLGPDFQSETPAVIDARIRETTDYASVLFFITVNEPHRAGTIFYSRNLHGADLPDVPGERRYSAGMPGIGELRLGEFILGRFDVTIATPLHPVREVMERYRHTCLWLLALMAVVAGATGVVFSGMVLRPLRLIRATANRIGADNLSERIPVADVADEISDLARLLNQMFDRLESAFDQIRRFSAEASHELKTPLSLLRLQAERLLVQGRLSAGDEETVQQQLEELARLNQIIEDLLFLSRAEAKDIALPIAAHEPMTLLRGFAQDARLLAEHRGRRFEFTHEGEGAALYAPASLRRVLLNLLTNALDASPAAATVTLRSQLEPLEWRLTMVDEGPGVPAADRERIFARFVRLRARDGEEGGGNGLGLAICRSIVQLHRGTIHAEAGPGGVGLSVVIRLPRAWPAEGAKAGSGAGRGAAGDAAEEASGG
ncbi:MAG: HAMP domain-containing protein [Proteobacteria bacterium]|nr:HAMP domain-containing protein [Pseudomonadota bacterium]